MADGIEIDGGGIDLTPGEGGGGNEDPHLRFEAQLQLSLTRRSEIQTWEGTQSAILEKFNAVSIGTVTDEVQFLGEGGSPTSGAAWDYARVTQVTAPRRQGKLWTMQITVSQVRYLTIWTLDFADIDKPIRTWLAGTDDAPDLALLSKWELAGEKQDWANYDSYKTVDGEALEDNTLKLAKMIREDGIESYTMHTPVVTCQATYGSFPDGAGGLLDKWLGELPRSAGGWPDMGGGSSDAVRVQLDHLKDDWAGAGAAGVWLCTADPVHPNADGSYLRSTQFTLATSVNEDLYEEGRPTDGGFA